MKQYKHKFLHKQARDIRLHSNYIHIRLQKRSYKVGCNFFPEVLEIRSSSMLGNLVSHRIETSINVLKEARLKRITNLKNFLDEMSKVAFRGPIIYYLDSI